MSFVTNFWPQENQYKQSLDKLDGRLQQSLAENEQLVGFLAVRVAVEEQYGKSLKEVAEKRRHLLTRPTGFDVNPDDGASLGHAFAALKTESTDLGQQHLELAEKLRETALNPLEKVTKDYHNTYIKYKEGMLSKVNLFEKNKSIVDIARRNYIEKCQAADKMEEAAISLAHKKEEESSQVKKGSVAYVFGKLTLSEPDLKAFLIKAQSEGTSQDSKSMFLGLFRGLQSGEAIVQWLLHAYSPSLKTPADAAEVGQALIDQNFLRLIGPGNQFKLAPTAFYQWKKRADEYEDGEPPHYQARKVAEEADKHYRNAVYRCDEVRTKLEEATLDYLIEMEKSEGTRIKGIKQVFLALTQLETNLSSQVGTIVAQLSPHVDSLKPQQDVALMAETLAVGPFRPSVIVYHNHYHGPGLDQRFGIPIDTLARVTKSAVPTTLSLLLESLERVSEGQPESERITIWCCESTLEEVHQCRAAINHSQAQLNDLFGYEAGVLASTLRLFLQELPDSLIPSGWYDNLKGISVEVMDEERHQKLTTCFKELTIPQRATIQALLSPLRSMVNTVDPKDPQFIKLTQMYSLCLLRPPDHQAVGSAHHRHPHRVFKDLLGVEGIVPAPSAQELTDWLAAPSPPSPTKQPDSDPPSDPVPPTPPTDQSPPSDLPPPSSSAPLPAAPSHNDDDDYLDLDLEDLAGDDTHPDQPIDLKDDFFDDV